MVNMSYAFEFNRRGLWSAVVLYFLFFSRKVNKNAASTPSIIAQLLLIYLFDYRFGTMFNKKALESLKRITCLIISNVIDTRFEHSIAQVRLFLSYSSLRLTSFSAKNNGYPEQFPNQIMWMLLAKCDSKTTGSLSGSKNQIISMLFGRPVPNRTYSFSPFRESSLIIKHRENL